jgi:ATP adenylyltransferase
MDRMWSPWRSAYIDSFRGPAKKRKRGESIFSAAFRAGDDAGQLIVWRSRLCFTIMNRYPYNSGHLMVVPNRQTADVLDLSAEELADITANLQTALRVLQEAMGPQGFNIGANLGRVAGAGVADHVHFHIVPRWNGDINFMPVIGETKVISEDMRRTYKKLQAAYTLLTGDSPRVIRKSGKKRSPRAVR